MTITRVRTLTLALPLDLPAEDRRAVQDLARTLPHVTAIRDGRPAPSLKLEFLNAPDEEWSAIVEQARGLPNVTDVQEGRAAADSAELTQQLVERLAYRTLTDGQKSFLTHGDPVLVDAFEALGWSDPYVVPPEEPPAPDQGLPGAGIERPDHELPGVPVGPDQGLPAEPPQ